MENTFDEFIKDKTVEIEVRFGTYGVSFTPEIKKEQFDRAFIFLKNYYEHSIHLQKIENYKNIRKITENDKVTFSEKSKIKNIYMMGN